MIAPILFWIVAPFVLGGLVIRFLRKYGADTVPPEVRRLCAGDPVERRRFRLVRAEGLGTPAASASKVGDFDLQQDAVDAAYLSRSKEPAGRRSEFLVLDDKGDVLESV